MEGDHSHHHDHHGEPPSGGLPGQLPSVSSMASKSFRNRKERRESLTEALADRLLSLGIGPEDPWAVEDVDTTPTGTAARNDAATQRQRPHATFVGSFHHKPPPKHGLDAGLKQTLQKSGSGGRGSGLQRPVVLAVPSGSPPSGPASPDVSGDIVLQELQRLSGSHAFVLDPSGTSSKLWDLVLFIVVLNQFFGTLARFGFGVESDGNCNTAVSSLDVMFWLYDCVFVMDFIIKFRKGYYDKYYNKVMKPSVIARRYMHSLQFYVDLLAILPLELIELGLPCRTDLLRLNKLLKIYEIPSRIKQYENSSGTQHPATRLFKLTLYVAILSHSTACMLLLVARQTTEPLDAWLPLSDFEALPPASRYARAVYLGVGMLVGAVNPGVPTTVSEYAVTLVTLFAGVFLVAYTIGTMNRVVDEINVTKTEFRAKLGKLNTFMSHHRLGKNLRTRIISFNDFLYHHSDGYDEDEVLQDLPACVQADLRLHLLRDMVHKVPFLTNCDHGFLISLVRKLEPEMVPQGAYVATQGEEGRHLYFIQKGQLEVLKDDVRVRMLNEGDYFGEQAVIRSSPRTASVLAVTIAHLLRLSREDFTELLEVYPDTAAAIRKATEAQIDEAKRRDEAVQNAFSTGRRISDIMSEEGAETPRTRNTRIHAGIAELAALEARWWHFFAVTRRVPAIAASTYSTRDALSHGSDPHGGDRGTPPRREHLHYRCLCPCEGGHSACACRAVGPLAFLCYRAWRCCGWTATCGRRCRLRLQPLPLQTLFARDFEADSRPSHMSWALEGACCRRVACDHAIACVCRRRGVGRGSAQTHPIQSPQMTLSRRNLGKDRGKVPEKFRPAPFFKPVVHPASTFRRNWIIIAFTALLYNFFFIPLRLSFLPLYSNAFYTCFDIITDIVYWLHIYLSGRTAVIAEGKLLTDPITLRNRYLKRTFPLDFLASLPLDWIALGAGLEFFFAFRVNRLILMWYWLSWYDEFSRTSRFYSQLKLLKLVLVLFTALHLSACSYFAFTWSDGFSASAEEWLPEDDLKDRSVFFHYFRALYFVLTPVGMGRDMSPPDDSTTLFSLLVFLVGLYIYAYLIGSIGNLLEDANDAQAEFNRKRNVVKHFLQRKEVDEDLLKRVLNFYKAWWAAHQGIEPADVLTLMPPSLASEVMVSVVGGSIRSAPLFKGVSDKALQKVVANARLVVLPQGEAAIRKNELGDGLYFVSRGLCAVYRDKEDLDSERPLKVLGPGAFFGEAVLFGHRKRLVTVVAKTTSELLELSHTDFHVILEDHPDIAARLRKLSHERRRSATQGSLQAMQAALLSSLPSDGGDESKGTGGGGSGGAADSGNAVTLLSEGDMEGAAGAGQQAMAGAALHASTSKGRHAFVAIPLSVPQQ